jgi:hypothetical protein
LFWKNERKKLREKNCFLTFFFEYFILIQKNGSKKKIQLEQKEGKKIFLK